MREGQVNLEFHIITFDKFVVNQDVNIKQKIIEDLLGNFIK